MYTFNSTEFVVGPSVTDYGMRREYVADEQGASKIYPWLNHDIQAIVLDDSQFQDIEDHVDGDD